MLTRVYRTKKSEPEVERDEYVSDFVAVASSAALSGLAEIEMKDSAIVLTAVMSHAIDLLASQDINVTIVIIINLYIR